MKRCCHAELLLKHHIDKTIKRDNDEWEDSLKESWIEWVEWKLLFFWGTFFFMIEIVWLDDI